MSHPLITKLESMDVDVEEALERRFMDDEETYVECLFEFADDPSMNDLIAATATRNVENAIRAIHTLKGLADSLGIMPLLDVSADMLSCFRSGRNEIAFTMLSAVRAKYQKYIDVIRSFM